MKGHYEGGGIDKQTMHAMNVRKLASDVRIFFLNIISLQFFKKLPGIEQCAYIL